MDLGFDPEIVAMDDFAVIKIREGRQADMRVRPDIEPMAALELGRAEMIEKHERPDRAPAHVRQRAAHRKPIQINAARDDDDLQRVAGVAVARSRVLAGEKTHGSGLFDGWNTCGWRAS